MNYRFADDMDLDLLAEWNRRLIRDEGHRNPMTLPEIRQRMKDWLAGEYKAVVFEAEAEPIAYALYRETRDEVYLRQFFVDEDKRRAGLGRAAIKLLRWEVWPSGKRLTVEALTANPGAVSFWRAVGYRDYCLKLEILP